MQQIIRFVDHFFYSEERDDEQMLQCLLSLQQSTKMTRILLTNSVPLNGGDEALLEATLLSLRRRFPESTVTVLCKDLEKSRLLRPDLKTGFRLGIHDARGS